MRKFLFITATLLFIFSSAALCVAIDELELKADTLSYSDDGLSIEAIGSVEALTNDMTIEAARLQYSISSKEISTDQNFTLKVKNGFIITGDKLNYNLRTKIGNIKNISFFNKSIVMHGSSADLTEEKIELSNASFNACGLDQPHYHISSSTTTIYQQDGWVIGYWGFLWIGQVPTIPVPVYIYDMSLLGQKGTSNTTSSILSVPELGNNDEDGNYIIERVPWIWNRKLSGRVVLQNTDRGGFAPGVEGNYTLDEYNDLYFRAMHDTRYNTFGGITHTYRFGPDLLKAEKNFYTFLSIKESLMFDLVTDLSYKERVNYQRVTKLPEVTLRLNNINAIFDNLTINGALSYGKITEETTAIGSDRGVFRTNGVFEFPTDIGKFTVGIGYNQSWYAFEKSWTRLTQNIRLYRKFNETYDGYVRHLHYLNYTGNSLFAFEAYQNLPSDEFGLGLGYNFWSNRLTVDYSYYVPSWDVQDLDYGISFGFHCYTLDIKYRAARKETSFGVSLINI